VHNWCAAGTVRMARLISKKCASNYERLKGAVRSTVQDIFKGA